MDVDALLDLAEEVVQVFVDVCLTDGDWVAKIDEGDWRFTVMPLY